MVQPAKTVARKNWEMLNSRSGLSVRDLSWNAPAIEEDKVRMCERKLCQKKE